MVRTGAYPLFTNANATLQTAAVSQFCPGGVTSWAWDQAVVPELGPSLLAQIRLKCGDGSVISSGLPWNYSYIPQLVELAPLVAVEPYLGFL